MIGISADDTASHNKFVKKHDLEIYKQDHKMMALLGLAKGIDSLSSSSSK